MLLVKIMVWLTALSNMKSYVLFWRTNTCRCKSSKYSEFFALRHKFLLSNDLNPHLPPRPFRRGEFMQGRNGCIVLRHVKILSKYMYAFAKCAPLIIFPTRISN